MPSSMVRSALVGAAGIAIVSPAPTAGAEEVRARTGERVSLCVPMTPEDGGKRASVSMELRRMLPDDLGCEVGIRANNGMGPSDILSTAVPFELYAYINVFGTKGVDDTKTITGTCMPDWLVVNTRGSGATVGACTDRPLSADTGTGERMVGTAN